MSGLLMGPGLLPVPSCELLSAQQPSGPAESGYGAPEAPNSSRVCCGHPTTALWVHSPLAPSTSLPTLLTLYMWPHSPALTLTDPAGRSPAWASTPAVLSTWSECCSDACRARALASSGHERSSHLHGNSRPCPPPAPLGTYIDRFIFICILSAPLYWGVISRTARTGVFPVHLEQGSAHGRSLFIE